MPHWIDNHPEHQESFDLIHVDGGHSLHCIINDMKHADMLVKKGGILIIDDVTVDYIDFVVQQYLIREDIEIAKYFQQRAINIESSKNVDHRL